MPAKQALDWSAVYSFKRIRMTHHAPFRAPSRKNPTVARALKPYQSETTGQQGCEPTADKLGEVAADETTGHGTTLAYHGSDAGVAVS